VLAGLVERVTVDGRTVKALGLAIPETMLATANEMIQ
jgi:hypothetical protein